jgi:hypothetical protein
VRTSRGTASLECVLDVLACVEDLFDHLGPEPDDEFLRALVPLALVDEDHRLAAGHVQVDHRLPDVAGERPLDVVPEPVQIDERPLLSRQRLGLKRVLGQERGVLEAERADADRLDLDQRVIGDVGIAFVHVAISVANDHVLRVLEGDLLVDHGRRFAPGAMIRGGGKERVGTYLALPAASEHTHRTDVALPLGVNFMALLEDVLQDIGLALGPPLGLATKSIVALPRAPVRLGDL